MNELYYEAHLERRQNLFGSKDANAATPENLAFLTEQAQRDHALAVLNHLMQLGMRAALEVPPRLTSPDAKIFMQYGVARHLSDMIEVYRSLIHTAHKGRREPLSRDEAQTFSRDLNTLYINLRGVLDNLACCLMRARQPSLCEELRDVDIGLFTKKFRATFTAFDDIKSDIARHDDWNRELKSRRDPAAHRIPLYLPPSQLTSDEAQRANQLIFQQNEKLQLGQVEEANQLFDQSMRLGRFFPFFLHHPTEPLIPIYPTIPNDIAHLIEIATVVLDNLSFTQTPKDDPSLS